MSHPRTGPKRCPEPDPMRLRSVGFLIALAVARSVPLSAHPTRHNRGEAREQTPNLSAGTPPPHLVGIELRFGHHCHARPVWREGWGGWGRCCLYILHRSQCVNFLEPAVLSGGSQFLLPGCVWAKKVQPIGRMDCIFRCTAMCCLLCLVEPSLVASVPVFGETVYCDRSLHSRCKSAFTSRVA